MEQGRCQAHTPAPLGKDRERFLALLHDIETRKDSYAEQLSGITLANLSDQKDNSEKSHQTIMTSLLDGQGITKQTVTDETLQEQLWQARLVLSLAETLDKEEADLAMILADIDSDEISLFDNLKGEMDGETAEDETNPFAELQAIKAKMGQPRPGAMKKRFQAWKTLYASGTLPEDFWFLTTTDEEAAELLCTEYETQSGKTTAPLLLLDLPGNISLEAKDNRDQIERFRKETEQLRADIISKLTDIVSMPHLNLIDPVALLPDAGILARDWNEIIDYHFPVEQFGRRSLDLQFLANIGMDTLFKAQPDSEQTGLKHGVLAICSALRQQPS